MKTKKHKNKVLIILFSLFLSTFFLSLNSVFADNGCESNKIKDASGKCVCPSDRPQWDAYSNGCVDPTGGGVNDYDPNAGTAAQGQTVMGRPLTESKPITFKYKLLESFPGFFAKGQEMTNLPALVVAIYKFAIWTVGIAAMFMITIGGFMYMTSAGNTSKAGSAKGVITDALLGLVAALGAYLLLYVINPDLVKMDLNMIVINVAKPEPMPMGGTVPQSGRLSDAQAWQLLSAASINRNKPNCSTPQSTSCTSFDGIPAATIDRLIKLKNACVQYNSNCKITVTGGTEAGHTSHGPGNPMIDIRKDNIITAFLKDLKTKQQYGNYGIGQICTLIEDLGSVSYNHSYTARCQDPSTTPHFHLTFNGA